MITTRQKILAAVAAFVLELGLLLLLALSLGVDVSPDDSPTVTDQPPPKPQVLATLMPILPIPVPEVPTKLTFELVDASTPAAAPARPTPLISDQSSEAATEEESRNKDTKAMPTVTGVNQPGLDLVDQDFRDGEDPALSGGQPSPVAGPPTPNPPGPPPTPTAQVTEKPEKPEKPVPEVATARPDEQFLPLPSEIPRLTTKRPEDLLQPREPKETPRETAEAMPPRPPPGGGGQSGFQKESVKRAIEGTLSQRGKASLDVEDTPLGRYLKSVSRVIERDWQYACRTHRDLTTPGFLRVNFTISKDGKVTSVRSVDARDGGEASKWFTLNAVKGAKLPPIPPDVVEMLENGQLEINFNFLFF